MSGWATIKLADAGVRLIDCVHKTPTAEPEGYAYIAIPQMKNGYVDFSSARRIGQESFEAWTKKALPQAHDVVLSRRCNPGETAYVDGSMPFALGQNLVLLRADGTRVLPAFLRWLVRGPSWWEQISKYLNVGAVFDSLRCADVPNFELSIPPMDVQEQVCRLLGSFEDKINLNRRTNETLETMAKAVFKSWFVDFDPVHAKAAGKAPAHIDAETVALFPNAFGEDGLPVGWKEEPLDQVADFLNGLALQKYPAEPDEPSLPVVKIAELRSGLSAKSGRASLKVPQKYVIADGDLLFSWSGTLMTTLWSHGPGALNQHLFKVTSGRFPKWFYYLWVNHHLPEFQRIAASKATTMGHIQRGHLAAASVAVPDNRLLSAMTSVMQPLIDKQIANDLENRTLAVLRDLLLPKLMSGELRLRDAEKIIEGAA